MKSALVFLLLGFAAANDRTIATNARWNAIFRAEIPTDCPCPYTDNNSQEYCTEELEYCCEVGAALSNDHPARTSRNAIREFAVPAIWQALQESGNDACIPTSRSTGASGRQFIELYTYPFEDVQ